jgi:hypothetical protein
MGRRNFRRLDHSGTLDVLRRPNFPLDPPRLSTRLVFYRF